MRKENNALIYRFEYTGDAKIIIELHSHRLVYQCLEHGEEQLVEIKAPIKSGDRRVISTFSYG